MTRTGRIGLVCLVAGCAPAPSSTVAPAPSATASALPVAASSARPPVASSAPLMVSAPPPASSTAPPPPRRPPEEPKAAVAKLELRLEPRVALGEPLRGKIVNVDDHDHAFFIPGASNGCGPPVFQITFQGPRGVFRPDLSGMGCGQGLVPARWLVIPKGESIDFAHDTDAPMAGAGSALVPGKYLVKLKGAATALEGRVEILPRGKAKPDGG